MSAVKCIIGSVFRTPECWIFFLANSNLTQTIYCDVYWAIIPRLDRPLQKQNIAVSSAMWLTAITKWTWLSPVHYHFFACWQHKHQSDCCKSYESWKNKTYQSRLPLHPWSLWWQVHYSSCNYRFSSSRYLHQSNSVCQTLFLCWQIYPSWFTIINLWGKLTWSSGTKCEAHNLDCCKSTKSGKIFLVQEIILVKGIWRWDTSTNSVDLDDIKGWLSQVTT